MTNKTSYAQFFTPPHVAKMMSDLCKNEGRFLEPNGEMVFIVPDDCFRTSSNFNLFDFMHKRGTFSDIIYFKKSPFLPEVSQPVLIFRYVLGDMSKLTNVEVL